MTIELIPTPEKVQDLVLANLCLELRIAGKSVEQISAQTFLTEQEVVVFLQSGISKLSRRFYRNAQEFRLLQNERLDRLIEALWPAARDGKIGSLELLLQTFDMQNRLFGLYAPTRISGEFPPQNIDQAIEAELRKLLASRLGEEEEDGGPGDAEGLENLAGTGEADAPQAPADQG